MPRRSGEKFSESWFNAALSPLREPAKLRSGLGMISAWGTLVIGLIVAAGDATPILRNICVCAAFGLAGVLGGATVGVASSTGAAGSSPLGTNTGRGVTVTAS